MQPVITHYVKQGDSQSAIKLQDSLKEIYQESHRRVKVVDELIPIFRAVVYGWSDNYEAQRGAAEKLLYFMHLNEEEIRQVADQVFGKRYDPLFGDDRLCECGHPYYRHFDTYDGMNPVGCKYCSADECSHFRLKDEE